MAIRGRNGIICACKIEREWARTLATPSRPGIAYAFVRGWTGLTWATLWSKIVSNVTTTYQMTASGVEPHWNYTTR